MIPKFPKFKLLDIKDKEEIEMLNKKFPPYSDFNFVSLFSWDIDQTTNISILNKNLVVKIQDYITKDCFFSFLGINDVDDTVIKLISHAKNTGVHTTLKLIPESVIKHFHQPNRFNIVEDVNNFDYILSTSELINLNGKKWRGKKNFINRFNIAHNETNRVELLNLKILDIQNQIFDVFDAWKNNNNKSHKETINEKNAIKKLLKYSDALRLRTIGVFIENKLRAFSINEVLRDKSGIIHYEKADTVFTGIFQFLKQQSAIDFRRNGCEYINYEQDLGIEGIRKAKLAHHPIKFLKKHTIDLASSA